VQTFKKASEPMLILWMKMHRRKMREEHEQRKKPDEADKDVNEKIRAGKKKNTNLEEYF
jgi:hypothetical protein